MLWPLTNGGTSVLPEQRERWTLEEVVDIIRAHGITMTDFVPTLFKLLVRGLQSDAIAQANLASLRHVLIGGEEIDAASVHAFRRLLPGCAIVNTYGQTGEIVVAGLCVGAGYLGDPERSAGVFVANPFPDLPGQMVYRSGDLGRFRPDGMLEYGGRADDEVKVRGVRIELAELALAMRACFPALHDVLPCLVQDADGSAALAIAYAGPELIPPATIRQALASRLAATHLPRFAMRLDEFPVTPNGKVDRRRIVAELSSLTAVKLANDAAPGSLASVLACYRQVLCAATMEADADFIAAGGDSLAAISLALQLATALGRDVPVADLYRHPTPRALHAALTAKTATDGMPGVAADRPQLPDVHYSHPGVPAPVSQHLLLTGATGFVGIHLLQRLLAEGSMHITAVVRAASDALARERLVLAYAQACEGMALPQERISIVAGDLTLPCFGMADDEWRRLYGTVDEVMHCAAAVNFLLSPAHLYQCNVAGTAELIRFCQQGNAKRLHHISSLAAKPQQAVVDLLTQQQAEADCMSGYGYTKYLADSLVLRARSQGLAAVVYQVDDVLPAISSGHANHRSMVHLLLAYCLRNGVAPTGLGNVGLLAADALAGWLCRAVGRADRFNAQPPLVEVTGSCHVPFEELVEQVAIRLQHAVRRITPQELSALLARQGDIGAPLLRAILPDGAVRLPFTAAAQLAKKTPAPDAMLLAANVGDFGRYIARLRTALTP